MKTSKLIICGASTVIFLLTALKGHSQLIDSTPVNDCTTERSLAVSVDQSSKTFSLKLDGGSLITAKPLSDTDIVTTIKKKLVENFHFDGCGKPEVIANFQDLLCKYPALIAAKLSKKPNTVTRQVKLNANYKLEEVLSPDYNYGYVLVPTDPKVINQSREVFGIKGSVYQFINKTDDTTFKNSLVTLIRFITQNKDIGLDKSYLAISSNSQKILLDASVQGKDIISGNQVEFSNAQKDSVTLKLTDHTISGSADVKVYEITSFLNKEKKPDDTGKSTSKRIAFGVGVGPTVLLDHAYQLPVVNKSNNNVILENAQKTAINISLGATYTPFYFKQTDAENPEGILVPKGWTFGAFINPVNLLKYSDDQSIFNPVDFGLGIGYKTAGLFSIMGTFNLMSIRQPRQWFIDQYLSMPQPYTVPDSKGIQIPQQSFDYTDNNIFRNKLYASIGFKIVFTFDIVKSYTAAVKN